MRIAHKGLRRFSETGSLRGIDPAAAGKLERILGALAGASEARDLDYAGWRLHRLKGGMAERWSVRVNNNWRVVFRFEDGEAVDVDLVDYH